MTPVISDNRKIVVLGAGKYGRAWTENQLRGGKQVTVWSRNPSSLAQLREQVDGSELPGSFSPALGEFRDRLHITSDLKEATRDPAVLLLVVNSQGLGEVLPRLVPHRDSCVVSLVKGFVLSGDNVLDAKTPSQACRAQWGHDVPFAVVTGPAFADEVADPRISPSVHLAAPNEEIAHIIARLIINDGFSIRWGLDVLGAEICGILKNVYSILLGVFDGLKEGSPKDGAQHATCTRVTFVSRILAEMGRIVEGWHTEDAPFDSNFAPFGLAGLGDLLLSSDPEKGGRNYNFGKQIAKGESPRKILESSADTIEGYRSAIIADAVTNHKGLDTPYVDAVVKILEGQNPAVVVNTLMYENAGTIKREFRHVPTALTDARIRALLTIPTALNTEN